MGDLIIVMPPNPALFQKPARLALPVRRVAVPGAYLGIYHIFSHFSHTL